MGAAVEEAQNFLDMVKRAEAVVSARAAGARAGRAFRAFGSVRRRRLLPCGSGREGIRGIAGVWRFTCGLCWPTVAEARRGFSPAAAWSRSVPVVAGLVGAMGDLIGRVRGRARRRDRWRPAGSPTTPSSRAPPALPWSPSALARPTATASTGLATARSNASIHRVTVTRLCCHPEAGDYVARRRAEGRSTKRRPSDASNATSPARTGDCSSRSFRPEHVPLPTEFLDIEAALARARRRDAAAALLALWILALFGPARLCPTAVATPACSALWRRAE